MDHSLIWEIVNSIHLNFATARRKQNTDTTWRNGLEGCKPFALGIE